MALRKDQEREKPELSNRGLEQKKGRELNDPIGKSLASSSIYTMTLKFISLITLPLSFLPMSLLDIATQFFRSHTQINTQC